MADPFDRQMLFLDQSCNALVACTGGRWTLTKSWLAHDQTPSEDRHLLRAIQSASASWAVAMGVQLAPRLAYHRL